MWRKVSCRPAVSFRKHTFVSAKTQTISVKIIVYTCVKYYSTTVVRIKTDRWVWSWLQVWGNRRWHPIFDFRVSIFDFRFPISDFQPSLFDFRIMLIESVKCCLALAKLSLRPGYSKYVAWDVLAVGDVFSGLYEPRNWTKLKSSAIADKVTFIVTETQSDDSHNIAQTHPKYTSYSPDQLKCTVRKDCLNV